MNFGEVYFLVAVKPIQCHQNVHLVCVCVFVYMCVFVCDQGCVWVRVRVCKYVFCMRECECVRVCAYVRLVCACAGDLFGV